MLPKVARIALLFDFYGKLLTEKQQKIVELYYHHDLSLGEIAEEYGISRQAVHDIIRRSETALEQFEQTLGILDKYFVEQEQLKKALELLNESEQDRNKVAAARNIIMQLMQATEE